MKRNPVNLTNKRHQFGRKSYKTDFWQKCADHCPDEGKKSPPVQPFPILQEEKPPKSVLLDHNSLPIIIKKYYN